MSTEIHQRHCQGPKSNKVFNEYERLQEDILRQTGVTCCVLVTPEHVSLRTESYADYCLARNAIKGKRQPADRTR